MYVFQMLNIYIQHVNNCHRFVLATEPSLDEIHTQPNLVSSIFFAFTHRLKRNAGAWAKKGLVLDFV